MGEATKKHWIQEAADEIAKLSTTDYTPSTTIQDIIEKHCPFKRDVAYEEVGEVSRKLDELSKTVLTIKRAL